MQIESRPMRSDPLAAAVAPGVGRRFRYLFYLDVIGNLADPAMQNALRHLQARPLAVAWSWLTPPLLRCFGGDLALYQNTECLGTNDSGAIYPWQALPNMGATKTLSTCRRAGGDHVPARAGLLPARG